MDPNAALKIAREAAQAFRDGRGVETKLHYAEELAVYFDNLDDWLSRAGFLPSDWQRGR